MRKDKELYSLLNSREKEVVQVLVWAVVSQEANFGLPGYSYRKFIKRELKWTEQWEKFFFCVWPHIALVKEKFG